VTANASSFAETRGDFLSESELSRQMHKGGEGNFHIDIPKHFFLKG
jgi:hypothetical protein